MKVELVASAPQVIGADGGVLRLQASPLLLNTNNPTIFHSTTKQVGSQHKPRIQIQSCGNNNRSFKIPSLLKTCLKSHLSLNKLGHNTSWLRVYKFQHKLLLSPVRIKKLLTIFVTSGLLISMPVSLSKNSSCYRRWITSLQERVSIFWISRIKKIESIKVRRNLTIFRDGAIQNVDVAQQSV
jgi:hypothetical protein